MIRIFLIMLLYLQCFCRVFQTSMKFSHIGSNKGWIFLNKMSFAPGTVQYKVKTSVKGIAYGNEETVIIQAIPQNLWQQQKTKKCQNLQQEPLLQHKLQLHSQVEKTSLKSFDIDDTTLYYFVLKDCRQSLKDEYDNKNLDFHISIHLLNNGRQLGQEQDHWYIVPIIVLTSMWLAYFYTQKLKGINMKSQLHKFVMFIGIATQVSSLTWRTFGFIIYTYTGFDYGFFHFIYLLMHSISESIVIGLIILIGFGWTINFMTVKNTGIYLPLAIMLALVNTVLTLLSKFSTNDHDRHHLFDNITGSVIIIYRFVFLIIFLGGIIYSYFQSRAKVKTFILAFGVFGTIYITALPIIVFISNNWIPAKDRHQFVFVAVETLKCITNIILSLMLNIQKSQYNQISYKNKSFMPEQSNYF